jgi:aryl-alcohol dehydrogenase-like predicted oxidoreductase
MSQQLATPGGPRRLGKSDLVVGRVAYGCWRFAGNGPREARALVEAALAAGMTLFDTADIYGLDGGQGVGAAESLLGRVFAEAPGLRERIALATKCGIVPGVPYDSSPAHVRSACEASLRRLGVDVIDLYQVHRPDWLAHPEELAGVLAELRQAGKVREVGVSNYAARQLDALQAFLPFPVATHQPELSAWRLAPLRDGVLDQCLQRGITPLAWSPLAGGLLGLPVEAARARRPDGERLAGLLCLLDRLAAERGVPRSAVALAFLLAHPAGVVPIVGTQRPERIGESARALEVRLTRSEWYDVVEASTGARLP